MWPYICTYESELDVEVPMIRANLCSNPLSAPSRLAASPNLFEPFSISLAENRCHLQTLRQPMALKVSMLNRSNPISTNKYTILTDPDEKSRNWQTGNSVQGWIWRGSRVITETRGACQLCSLGSPPTRYESMLNAGTPKSLYPFHCDLQCRQMLLNRSLGWTKRPVALFSRLTQLIYDQGTYPKTRFRRTLLPFRYAPWNDNRNDGTIMSTCRKSCSVAERRMRTSFRNTIEAL